MTRRLCQSSCVLLAACHYHTYNPTRLITSHRLVSRDQQQACTVFATLTSQIWPRRRRCCMLGAPAAVRGGKQNLSVRFAVEDLVGKRQPPVVEQPLPSPWAQEHTAAVKILLLGGSLLFLLLYRTRACCRLARRGVWCGNIGGTAEGTKGGGVRRNLAAFLCTVT